MGHEWGDENITSTGRNDSGEKRHNFHGQSDGYGGKRDASQGSFCIHCNAWLGSLGLEPTPELFVKHMVQVFREVKRVLRKDGTCWCNLGSSYWGGKGQSAQAWSTEHTDRDTLQKPYHQISGMKETRPSDGNHPIFKPKDMVPIPWMVAIALQADGWYLRSDIIWAKPNPMPESVTDRPTKSHEYVFLLSKNQKYYYDADAIREPYNPQSFERNKYPKPKSTSPGRHKPGITDERYKESHIQPLNPNGRNRRSVWTIPTEAFPEAHFATFPKKLVEPCILAGTSAQGCCPKCGAGWVRVVEKPKPPKDVFTKGKLNGDKSNRGLPQAGQKLTNWLNEHPSKTIGWQPSCKCNTGEPIPCTVLDCFSGAGTSWIVSYKHGRQYIGIELSTEYCKTTKKRIERETRQLKMF